MNGNKPIKLDFERIRDYIRQGILDNSGAAYVAKDFAVLLSFNKLRKKSITLNQPYRFDELRVCRIKSGTGKAKGGEYLEIRVPTNHFQGKAGSTGSRI